MCVSSDFCLFNPCLRVLVVKAFAGVPLVLLLVRDNESHGTAD